MDPTSTSALLSSPTESLVPNDDSTVVVKHINPVVAFIIGLAIILLASILNAAGLNLTKLDHVRTSTIPKANRKKDWMRPLWLLGMILYILSQLIGSTLALEYMRAEYVAPLGSSSLVFNFLFARFLVGTPVTSTDIYGTIIVILGVVGIVAFGSINSGLASETDVKHLTYLWRRGGWLGFFFSMTAALILLLFFTTMLDQVLASRSDDTAVPFASMGAAHRRAQSSVSTTVLTIGGGSKIKDAWKKITRAFSGLMTRIGELLEYWTAAKDDKTVAWTLGIGWACCGGGLAGGTLVFAKAIVKLISGSLSHENGGNQLGHVAPIFTIILLAITAVLQIICLNRGLKVYDSTLVVPVFYGVYTATGFLNSLVFNDEVDAYKSWTLALIFLSILVLISGVVLLTHKKPEPTSKPGNVVVGPPPRGTAGSKRAKNALDGEDESDDDDGDEERRLRSGAHDDNEEEREDRWAVGNASDDDSDVDHHQYPLKPIDDRSDARRGRATGLSGTEGEGLMADSADEDDEVDHGRRQGEGSSYNYKDAEDDFGEWADAPSLGAGSTRKA